jgi:hypothetical protein
VPAAFEQHVQKLRADFAREHPEKLDDIEWLKARISLLAKIDQYGRTVLGRARARAAFKSCLNKSISNGLSIRGLFEVASFRPGKAVEAGPYSPPVFEVSPVLIS